MSGKEFQSNTYGFSNIYAFDNNGPVDVMLAGTNNSVGASGSVVTVTGGSGFDSVSVGLNGTANIALDGYGNSITTYFSANGTIYAGDGGAQVLTSFSHSFDIQAEGFNNNIRQFGGTGSIQAGFGNDSVIVGGGTGSVDATGFNNSVTIASGTYDVDAGATATINAATVGLSNLTAEGYNNHFILSDEPYSTGTFTDVVNAGAGSDTVTQQGGTTQINLSGFNNTVSVDHGTAAVNGGAGNDVFTIGNAAVLDLFKLNTTDQVDIKSQTGTPSVDVALSHAVAVLGGTAISFGPSGTVYVAGATPSTLDAHNFKVT